MDLSSTFRAEAYRPVVTIVLPATTASLPYGFIVIFEYPHLYTFIHDHPAISTILALLIILAVGLVLENLGSLIEAHVLERWLGDSTRAHEVWYRYLGMSYEIEPIGQRYLRTITVRLKFELSFAVALSISAIGCLCARYVGTYVAPLWLYIVFVVLIVYLMWEAKNSASLLRRLRCELVNRYDQSR